VNMGVDKIWPEIAFKRDMAIQTVRRVLGYRNLNDTKTVQYMSSLKQA
jgi:hypothetical protein